MTSEEDVEFKIQLLELRREEEKIKFEHSKQMRTLEEKIQDLEEQRNKCKYEKRLALLVIEKKRAAIITKHRAIPPENLDGFDASGAFEGGIDSDKLRVPPIDHNYHKDDGENNILSLI